MSKKDDDRRYRERHKEQIKSYMRRYYLEHRKEILLKSKIRNGTIHPNFCRRCGILISHLHPETRYCKFCRKIRDRETHRKANHNYKRRIKARESLVRHYEVTVGYNCLACGEFVAGKRHSPFCKDCKKRWNRQTPRWVREKIFLNPSFSEMPEGLRKWKKVTELREDIKNLRK